jgi:hypothetical protein
MIYRGPGFLADMIWLLPHPLVTTHISFSRQKARPATHRKTEKERQLVEWEGVGKEPNHTIARKPDPL